jgi:hypothetical protein
MLSLTPKAKAKLADLTNKSVLYGFVLNEEDVSCLTPRLLFPRYASTLPRAFPSRFEHILTATGQVGNQDEESY